MTFEPVQEFERILLDGGEINADDVVVLYKLPDTVQEAFAMGWNRRGVVGANPLQYRTTLSDAEMDAAGWVRKPSPFVPAATPAVLPDMNEELVRVLGRPNFACREFAALLRAAGTAIAAKSEHEQAHVLHFLLSQYLIYGDAWAETSEAELHRRLSALEGSMSSFHPDSLVIGAGYNWEYQTEKLVYLGTEVSNGVWYQFAKLDDPTRVWCEVRARDLYMLEATPVESCPGFAIEPGVFSGCNQSSGDCPTCGN